MSLKSPSLGKQVFFFFLITSATWEAPDMYVIQLTYVINMNI